ncbi:hypothetical protein BT93_G1253 [Corymbia citriodora subsp. variegata]|nr:hypothetical protein BT93_G1253 [Corymbia citriodora subsp. variegata]
MKQAKLTNATIRGEEAPKAQQLADAKEAVAVASDALHSAEVAYIWEGLEVLDEWRTDVHDMDEVGALMELLAIITRPYELESVRISDHGPQGRVMDADRIEQMREALVRGGFVHDHGNIYNIPPAAP